MGSAAGTAPDFGLILHDWRGAVGKNSHRCGILPDLRPCAGANSGFRGILSSSAKYPASWWPGKNRREWSIRPVFLGFRRNPVLRQSGHCACSNGADAHVSACLHSSKEHERPAMPPLRPCVHRWSGDVAARYVLLSGLRGRVRGPTTLARRPWSRPSGACRSRGLGRSRPSRRSTARRRRGSPPAPTSRPPGIPPSPAAWSPPPSSSAMSPPSDSADQTGEGSWLAP